MDTASQLKMMVPSLTVPVLSPTSDSNEYTRPNTVTVTMNVRYPPCDMC